MNINMYIPIAIIVISNVLYHICSKSTPNNINPFAAITITYAVGMIVSVILYYVFNRNGNIFSEYTHLNWSCYVLGLSLVGLEVGAIYMYKSGWNINTGQLVYSSILTVLLVIIGYFFYHEDLTLNKLIGIILCMAGLFFINK
ncbi:MAG: EamA family transporter [Lachnospirales bacterium]